MPSVRAEKEGKGQRQFGGQASLQTPLGRKFALILSKYFFWKNVQRQNEGKQENVDNIWMMKWMCRRSNEIHFQGQNHLKCTMHIQ